MASLRKRPEAADADAPEVAISLEADAPPAPARDDATEALARQIGSMRQSETVQQQAQAMQAAAQRRTEWLAATPGARDHIHDLGHIHQAALDSGLIDTSPEYFKFLEDQAASLPRPAAEAATHLAEEMHQRAAHDPEPPPPGRVAYSAPVSRDVPGSNGKRTPGKITLTPQQVEAARISGVSPEEYAKQMLRKAQMVASGEYGEDTRR